MLKCCLQNKLSSLFVQLNDLNFISVIFYETANGNTKPFVVPNAPVHRKHSPWRQIFVYLFLLRFILPPIRVSIVGYARQMAREATDIGNRKTGHSILSVKVKYLRYTRTFYQFYQIFSINHTQERRMEWFTISLLVTLIRS